MTVNEEARYRVQRMGLAKALQTSENVCRLLKGNELAFERRILTELKNLRDEQLERQAT